MISRIGVVLMGAALALYIVVLVWFAVMFFTAGTPMGIVMGVALAVFAPIGAWALIRELVFGLQADRLGRMLEREHGMPDDEVSLTPSGRVVKDEAGPLAAKYEQAVVANPADWRAHYRLGVVYGASGRGKDGRAAIREAIRRARS